jgi:hypothetical protein
MAEGEACSGAKSESGYLERSWSRIEKGFQSAAKASGLDDEVDEDAGNDFDGSSHPSFS